MPQLLNEDIIKQIREVFEEGLKNPVHMMFFGKKENCQYCEETRQLAEEVAAISDLLSIDFYDMDADADLAEKYNVDKAPGLVIAAKEGDQVTDFGVRLAGIPSGHEFTSLIQDLVLVSSRDSGLNPQTRDFLKELDKPILLQVHVTPT
jgi:glutaredoxin-like protein